MYYFTSKFLPWHLQGVSSKVHEVLLSWFRFFERKSIRFRGAVVPSFFSVLHLWSYPVLYGKHLKKIVTLDTTIYNTKKS